VADGPEGAEARRPAVNRVKTVAAFLRYNALHIFGGRFVVFLGLALGLLFLDIAQRRKGNMKQSCAERN
jgi:hypothetical protein